MQNIITITAADSKHREVIIDLLQDEKLPIVDLPTDIPNFFIATDKDFVIGAIGLEIYGKDGLLRSLVVKPEYRKMKIAKSLIHEVEKLAKNRGVDTIYLLTETAQGYFSGKGYQFIERKHAPQLLQQSSEFTHACPASATLMKKSL